jgi:drug/metabolite transporter (DMT)-like permease
MAATTSDYLKLHFIVFLWGFTAILGLFISIPAIELVIYRTLLASVGMGLLILAVRQNFRLPARHFSQVFLTGFVVAAHWITFFASARVSNASVSLVGIATGSLWAAFLEPLLNKRKIKGYEVLMGVLVIIGLYVIFAFDFHYPLGLFLGVLSGFLSALFFAINQRLGAKVGTYQITFFEMTGAFVGSCLYLLLHVTLVQPDYVINLRATTVDWLCIAILSLVCTVYAFSVSVNLMKRLSVFFMQLTLNLEPVYGIVLAVLIFGQSEKMTFQFYLGTVIILSAVISYPIIKKRFSPQVTFPTNTDTTPAQES